MVLAPGSSSSCWICGNTLLSYLYSFFWPLDHLITKKFCWDEASDTIIQTCLHSNGLTWAGTAVKVVPNLEQGKSKSHSAWKQNSPSSEHSKTSLKAVSANCCSQQRCGRAGDRGLQCVLPYFGSTQLLCLQPGRSEHFQTLNTSLQLGLVSNECYRVLKPWITKAGIQQCLEET